MRTQHRGLTLNNLVNILIVFSVLVTLVVCAIVGYNSDKQSLISSTLEFNRINAEKLAQTTNDLLTSAKKTLTESADYISHQDLKNAQLTLNFIKRSNNMFNSLFVVNEAGLVLLTSPESLGVVNKTLTSDAAIQALALKKPLISEPYIAITGRFIILVSVPIFDQSGDYKGFLAGSIYLHESNILESVLGTHTTSDSGSYVYVVSNKGELLYHPDKTRIGDVVMENPAVQQVVSGHIGTKVVTNTVGEKMNAGYAPVPEASWGIVSQTPASTVTVSARNLIWNICLYSVPLILLLIALAFVLIRYISRPLYKLAHFAENLNESNQAMPFPKTQSWYYEAKQLQKAMTRAISMMQEQIHTLSTEAQKDTLTGLNNRRTMDKVLQSWINSNTPFCYMILDIDHFKCVNDTYGHPMGDEVLKFLAQKMLELTSYDDDVVCCRYGGEEFVILVPNMNLDGSYLLAEHIRTTIEQSDSPIGKPITVSIGVASIDDSQGELEVMMQTADDALYRSKQSGRNKVNVG